MAIPDLDRSFLFIFISNPHLIVCTSYVKLNEILGSTLLIQRPTNQKKEILILDGQVF